MALAKQYEHWTGEQLANLQAEQKTAELEALRLSEQARTAAAAENDPDTKAILELAQANHSAFADAAIAEAQSIKSELSERVKLNIPSNSSAAAVIPSL